MTYSPNITYSKAGATLTCPICQDSDTYQIGKLDRQKWAVERKKYVCQTCRTVGRPTPVFAQLRGEQNDIDKLLELI
jgi:hypothetical protein